MMTKLESFNESHGFAKTGSRKVKNSFDIGKMGNIYHIDHSLENYHFMGRDIIPQQLKGRDMNEAWMRRAMLLSPDYLYEKSARSRKTDRDLYHLGELILGREGHVPNERITYQMVMNWERFLGDHPLKVLFSKHLQRCRWGEIMSSNIDGNSVVDLTTMTAWRVQDIHLHHPRHFYECRLYTLPTLDNDKDLSNFDDDEEWGRLSHYTMTYVYNPILETDFEEELPLYSAMQQLK